MPTINFGILTLADFYLVYSTNRMESKNVKKNDIGNNTLQLNFQFTQRVCSYVSHVVFIFPKLTIHKSVVVGNLE